MAEPGASRSLFSSLRRFVGTLLDIVQVRLELLGTELELEKRRLFDGLLWASFALLLLGLGLVLLSGFVVLLLWEGYRLAAVGCLALLFLGSGLVMLQHARQRLRRPDSMFGSSLAELQRDQAELSGTDRHE